LCLAANAATFTYINGEGFEAPSYSTTFMPAMGYAGQIEGQFGLVNDDFSTSQWRTIGSTSAGAVGPRVPGTATIQSAVPGPGGSLQSLEVVRGANSEDFWGIEFETTPVEPFVCIEWDIMVPSGQSFDPGALGPLFGIQAFDDQGAIGTLGGAYVDAATREILLQDGADLLISSTLIDYDQWHSFQMLLDYSTDTYSLFVDGAELFSGVSFVDPGLDEFSTADIFAGAGFFDALSLAATGVAYFDNYRVFETDIAKVPEPATLVLAGLCGMVLALRRRLA
jgi:hypothetical protein